SATSAVAASGVRTGHRPTHQGRDISGWVGAWPQPPGSRQSRAGQFAPGRGSSVSIVNIRTQLVSSVFGTSSVDVMVTGSPKPLMYLNTPDVHPTSPGSQLMPVI